MNNFSVLPFYSSVAEQNHRLPYAYGAVYPLYCDDTRILPFQIIRPTRQNTITSVILFDKDGTQVRDLTSDMSFDIVALEDYDVIVYTAQFGYAQELPIGQYYISVSDGAQTWFSDIFTIVSDITPYVKLEWYDEENFVMDAGTIIYNNPRFINRLYLNTEIGKPDYQFEEEGEQRDGYFFPEKQLTEKTYRFTILAPEYLCDVMRFIRMADHIQITAGGYTYNADTFLITPKWQTQGDLASVEVEFESNTVAKKLGDARVRRTIGDFNDDYNDDYDGGDTPVPPVPPTPTEAPENDVNFYDYTGFRVASYTIAEAKALTELPTPPSHEGLTFQEWNWTLNDIATYDRQYIDVGANYITTDGKTHIFSRITENNVTLSIKGRYGTISVNWGDGSAEDGYTYTEQAYHVFTHTYVNIGLYELVINFDQTNTSGDYFLSNRYVATSAGWIGISAYEIRYGSHILWTTENQLVSDTSYAVTIPADIILEGNQSILRSFVNTVVLPRNNAISFTLAYPAAISHLIFPRSVTLFGHNGSFMYRGSINRLVVPEYTDTTAKNANLFNSLFVNVLSLPSSVSFAAAATIDSGGLAYIDIVQGWTPNQNMTINQSYFWTAADLVKFFTRLGTTTEAITLTFGALNLNKLTAEQKAIATGKGYTLA